MLMFIVSIISPKGSPLQKSSMLDLYLCCGLNF